MGNLNKDIDCIHESPAAKKEVEEILAQKHLEDKNEPITESAIVDEIARYRLEINRKKVLGKYNRNQRKNKIRYAVTAAIMIFAIYLATPGGRVFAKNALEYIVSFGNNTIKQEGIEGYEPEYSIVPKEHKIFDNVNDASEYIGGIPIYRLETSNISLMEISVYADEDSYLISSNYITTKQEIIVIHETIFAKSDDARLALDDLDGEPSRLELPSGMDVFTGIQNDNSAYGIGVQNNILLQIFADNYDLEEFNDLVIQMVEY